MLSNSISGILKVTIDKKNDDLIEFAMERAHILHNTLLILCCIGIGLVVLK